MKFVPGKKIEYTTDVLEYLNPLRRLKKEQIVVFGVSSADTLLYMDYVGINRCKDSSSCDQRAMIKKALNVDVAVVIPLNLTKFKESFSSF